MKRGDKRLLCISFIWGVAEAIFFFVPPDFFLFPAALAKPKLWKELALFSLFGSIVGMLVLACCIFLFREQSANFLLALPFVSPDMFVRTTALLEASVFAPLLQPVSGMPVKVWIQSAIGAGMFGTIFIVTVALARAVRMFAVALIGSYLSLFLPQWMKAHPRVFVLLYAIGVVFALMLGIGV